MIVTKTEELCVSRIENIVEKGACGGIKSYSVTISSLSLPCIAVFKCFDRDKSIILL